MTPTADRASRSSPMRGLERFERRVLLHTLAVAVPWLAVSACLYFRDDSAFSSLLIVFVALCMTLAIAWRHQRTLVYPLYSLAGLLEALREGDYSLRGSPNSVLGDMVYDINALASELQSERQRWKSSTHLVTRTLESLDSAVLAFDESGRLVLINTSARRAIGLSEASLRHATVDSLGLAALLQSPQGRLCHLAFAGASGRFEVRHSQWRSDNRAFRLLVLSNVDRALHEEERASFQRLVRVLTHEVNNSLAPIRSLADTLTRLLKTEPPPADLMDDISGGLSLIGERSASLIRFLSGYAQVAQLPSPRFVETDLEPLIRRACRLEQRVPIVVEPGPPMLRAVDPDQLEHALINLIRNAAEAAGPRGNVRVAWCLEGGHQVIHVRDDGPGLPASDNLFVPFFTTKPGGSGIGLALVREILTQHDAQISLTNNADGRGATATIRFG